MDYYDVLLAKKLSDGGGGGSSVEVESLSATSNGTYTAEEGKAYSPVTVNVQRPKDAPLKDINFFDYDGTRLYSYSLEEWENVTELPPNPSHDGLISQGWNARILDINTWLEDDGGPVYVGQLYMPESEATEIDIELNSGFLSPYVTFSLIGTCTIDWGDGSTDTVTGTTLQGSYAKTTQHTYQKAGSYTIKIIASDGTTVGLGGGGQTSPRPILNSSPSSTLDNSQNPYQSAVKHVRVGKGVTQLNGYAFGYCSSLKTITFPAHQFTSFGESNIFYCCKSLGIIIPPTYATSDRYLNIWGSGCLQESSLAILCGGTSSISSGFRANRNIQYVHIRTDVTDINSNMFQEAHSLENVTIPSNVTTIKGSAFYNCRSLKYVHLKSTTPPTLENTNAFQYNAGSRTFYVPYSEDHSILDAYKTASNWSSYASSIVEESA